MRKAILTLAALAMLFATGCKKEEPAVDVRDAAVGNYNGTMTPFVLQSGELRTMDGLEAASIDLKLEKDSSNAGSVRLDVGGDIFYGSKIAVVSNGFVFDIEEQTASVDGTSCHVEGYNAITVGTSKYNGAFFSTDKKLSFGIRVSVSEFFAGETEILAALSSLGITHVVMVIDTNKR